MPRSRLRALHDSGALTTSHATKPLRAAIVDGQSISIDLQNAAINSDLAAAIRHAAIE